MATFVNDEQTNEERVLKYALLRELGFSSQKANKLRDFRYSSLRKRINIFLCKPQ